MVLVGAETGTVTAGGWVREATWAAAHSSYVVSGCNKMMWVKPAVGAFLAEYSFAVRVWGALVPGSLEYKAQVRNIGCPKGLDPFVNLLSVLSHG